MSKLTFQKRALYAFTIQKELEKNLNLEVDENIVSKERIRFYDFIFSPMGRIVLTNQRIAVVKHFQFKPDVFYSIDLKDIKKIEMVPDLDLPKSGWEKLLCSFNKITTGNINILNISFMMNGFSSTLKVFCWDYRFVYKGISWKPNNKKTQILFERLKSFL